ncbi:MAG: glycosidase [Planctomycetota bacterium]|nr:MAG: glycosidase [Planctomycetota bacterium]
MKRAIQNPLISPKDVSPSAEGFQVLGAFNPGATSFNGEILLLIRVAESCEQKEGSISVPTYVFENGTGTPQVQTFDLNDPDVELKDTRGVKVKGMEYLSTMSHIRIARSSDGVNFTVDPKPFLAPTSENECFGIEDARVTKIEGRYYINYTIVSPDSWCTALAVTDDFVSVERLGIIFPPENKDVCLFPEKVNGKYIAFHRPNNGGFGKASIWYAESPDLICWGNHKCMLRPRDTSYESMKIGGGSAPIKTDKGWLTIYHSKGDNQRYSLFALLLDLEEPWRVIKQAVLPLLQPEEPYETEGFFGNVVFTNGMVVKGDEIMMYYGASDETCCLATGSIKEILNDL